MAALVPGARVKGRGMMLGLDVRDAQVAEAICGRAAEAGLIIESCGPRDEIVKILAPLTTPETLLERGLDIVEEAVAAGREPVAV